MIFSLVPLAIAFAGVIGGSIRGAGSSQELFPTPEAGAEQPGGGGSGPAAPAGTTVFDITAKNLLFDKRSMTVPANTQITVRFNNQDPGIIHNFAVYKSKAATAAPLAPGSKGNLITGVASENITFTTPGPGTYYFHCDVHPDTMNGSFIVR
jgi:plastocyanin